MPHPLTICGPASSSNAQILLVWASTGGVTTTFTYNANGALVKKEDPLVGITYYVGPHYEVLVPAVILPPAPTDLEACLESGSPPTCATTSPGPAPRA